MIGRFDRLVDHMEWADERALEMVRDTGDDRARELLAHVLATERVWMSRIRTGDSSHLEIWPDLDLGTCETRVVPGAEGREACTAWLPSDTLSDIRRPSAVSADPGPGGTGRTTGRHSTRRRPCPSG